MGKQDNSIERCKVIQCNNSVMEVRDNSRNETMIGTYGYCQIHNIEGLVEEVS